MFSNLHEKMRTTFPKQSFLFQKSNTVCSMPVWTFSIQEECPKAFVRSQNKSADMTTKMKESKQARKEAVEEESYNFNKTFLVTHFRVEP